MNSKVLIALSFILSISFFHAQTVDTNFVDGRIYVKVIASSGMDLETYNNSNPILNQMILDYDIQSMDHAFKSPGALQKVHRVEFTEIADVAQLIADFETLPFIEYAEKAPLYHLQFTPNDLSTSAQYALDVIEAENAWDINKGSANVVIAIVDNGVNIDHEDLSGNLWVNSGEVPGNGFDDDLNGYTDDVNGYDAADRDGNPNPPAGAPFAFTHGSHCAGIATADTDNGVGIASIGYSVSLMSVKATRDNSDGNTLSAAFEGVDYALTAGADIISMSFGSSSGLSTWDVLINQAQTQGVLMVAAAGNDNSEDVFFPAGYDYVVSVGATDPNDNRASFSNYGSTIDVMAPGTNILSCLHDGNNNYVQLNGTSMACPLVAGLTGLLLSYDSSFSVQELKQFLASGCDNIDAQNPDFINKMGSGRINAFKSMQLAAGLTIDEINTENFSFGLYPNPTEGFLYIKPDQSLPPNTIITIYDLSGKLAHTQEFGIVLKGSNMLLNINDLDAGTYLLQFQNGEFNTIERFVKM